MRVGIISFTALLIFILIPNSGQGDRRGSGPPKTVTGPNNDWNTIQSLRVARGSDFPLSSFGLRENGMWTHLHESGSIVITLESNKQGDFLLISDKNGTVRLSTPFNGMTSLQRSLSKSGVYLVSAKTFSGTEVKFSLYGDPKVNGSMVVIKDLPEGSAGTYLGRLTAESGKKLTEVEHKGLLSQIVEGEKREKTLEKWRYLKNRLTPDTSWPTSREHLCQMARRPELFKNRILSGKSTFPAAFRDSQGKVVLKLSGYFNTGLCWWASRFERAATYLTIFRPEMETETRLDSDYVKSMYERIFSMRGVVEIPAKSLHDFIAKYPKELESVLSRAQLNETIKGKFFQGMKGESCPEGLGSRRGEIQKIINEVNKGRIAYVMLQKPGLSAHSALVVEAEELDDDHYRMLIKDPVSEKFNVVVKNYREDLIHKDVMDFDMPADLPKTEYKKYEEKANCKVFPYLQESDDFTVISRTLEQECGISNLRL